MKKISLSSTLGVALIAPIALLASTYTLAQTFPSKLLTIKVAFPAGGSADAGFRQFQPRLQASLGQTVIIENVPGAGGSIGAQAVMNAAPDGYTMLGTTGTDLILAPMSVVSAKYDPPVFRLIAPVLVTDFVLVSSNAHSFRNVEDLVKHARSPGAKELSIAHWGHGSTTHIVGADFETSAGITPLNIPYKGVAPIIPDLIGSQIDLSFLPMAGPTLGLIKAGKVRAIGVTGSHRNPHLPDVPALNEYRDLKDFQHRFWSGLFIPRQAGEAPRWASPWAATSASGSRTRCGAATVGSPSPTPSRCAPFAPSSRTSASRSPAQATRASFWPSRASTRWLTDNAPTEAV